MKILKRLQRQSQNWADYQANKCSHAMNEPTKSKSTLRNWSHANQSWLVGTVAVFFFSALIGGFLIVAMVALPVQLVQWGKITKGILIMKSQNYPENETDEAKSVLAILFVSQGLGFLYLVIITLALASINTNIH